MSQETNRPSRGRAVVLVSGGMDSCVAAAEAAARGHELCFLHVTYAQRTADAERRAFEAIANHYDLPAGRRRIFRLEALGEIGGSSLTDPAMTVAKGKPVPGRIPSSYVPFRNANLLAIAVSWAEASGATAVVIGAVEQDSSGYPDCRKEFYEAFERAVDLGTRPETGIEILTPLILMSKAEIVRRGVELEAPLHLTWSCYEDAEVACGECESCVLRRRGFADAGHEDPIRYRVHHLSGG